MADNTKPILPQPAGPSDPETLEWLESLDWVLEHGGPERVQSLLAELQLHAVRHGVRFPFSANTPFVNTIAASDEGPYPGDPDVERRLKSLIRWNAMAMVVRANREDEGIGGHISTYASAATLYEVAFNHFFRAPTADHPGDQIYFQGHASPGIYARAYLEGRLSEAQIENFRRELEPGGGLSSYPHPWLMPDFWQFPTVSMGLGPIMAIYQARFNRYLADRGLADTTESHVWAFLGDGETDEPESLGAISLAAREKLDNLIFVVNCNLQRLDGPVRGNGNIIQELEAVFRGAGWHVIKVLFGRDWDPLLARDDKGLLVRRWGEVVDGEVQRYAAEPGSYVREHFWGKYPELAAMVSHLSDSQLKKLTLGGHDPVKVRAAYQAAIDHQGAPVVILARTIKGYGLGEAGEGKNITHQQKKLNEDELREFRARFGVPISDEALRNAPLYRPDDDSREMTYLRERRAALGGSVPARRRWLGKLQTPEVEIFEEFFDGSDERTISTTMAFVRLLTKLLKHETFGPLLVPIVPDEARTFGMEALFRQCGIYSHVGQLYEPVDARSLLYYREAQNGQILEEGITEAGGMSSFIAAGTARSTHNVPTIPVFIFYSMFGFQRIGDLIWAAGDMRARGFLVGGTAGRTTLAGEGLQHQDGNSQLLAQTIPNCLAYDPAFAYEIAVIVRDGFRRMYEENEDVFYYLTVENEAYAMPAMPAGAEEGIVKGLHCVRPAGGNHARTVQLIGAGAILNETLAAAELLETKLGISAEVWSATSLKRLRTDMLEYERSCRLGKPLPQPWLPDHLGRKVDAVVCATDYVRAVADGIARWCPVPWRSLGTDGFGRSETRAALRNFFEVDARWVALTAVEALIETGKTTMADLDNARRVLELDVDKANPFHD